MKIPKYIIRYMQQHYGQYMDVRIDDVDKEYVLELHKALYGLKQASREWNQMFDAFMISAGFTRSRSDVCMYHKGDRDNKVIVLVYVDDIIVASKHDTLLDDFYTTMSARFQIESDSLHYYVGMQITIDVGQAQASIRAITSTAFASEQM